MTEHNLVSFMRQATEAMAADYRRIQARVREDPGTAGDQGEENWAALLRDWLPHTYHVVTKGRILGADGAASPQIDVLVLSPAYPPALLHEKYYFAGGVVAAFECKITLRSEHLAAAVESAALIAALTPASPSSPYREMHGPIITGLLAHSHAWQQPDSNPVGNVTAALEKHNAIHVSHPREMLDMACVADTGTWIGQRTSWIGPNARPDDNLWMATGEAWVPVKELSWAQLAPRYGPNGAATTMYVAFPAAKSQEPSFTPIGTFVTHLLRRIAWDDRQLRGVASYFIATKTLGQGRGTARHWDASVFSEKIRDRVLAGFRSGEEKWDEWGTLF